MNLDDMQKEWTERDQKLEASLQLNARLLREIQADRHNKTVRLQALMGFLIELPFYVVTIFALGQFIVHHIAEAKFALPASLLAAWCIAMLASLVRQYVAMTRLDVGEPVVTLQKKIVATRLARLQAFKWGFLSGIVLWCAPVFIVLAKAVLNVDLYAVSGFLVFNVATTMTSTALVFLLLKLFGKRLQHVGFVKLLMDSIAGRDIAKANLYLRTLTSFQQDEGQH